MHASYGYRLTTSKYVFLLEKISDAADLSYKKISFFAEVDSKFSLQGH